MLVLYVVFRYICAQSVDMRNLSNLTKLGFSLSLLHVNFLPLSVRSISSRLCTSAWNCLISWCVWFWFDLSNGLNMTLKSPMTIHSSMFVGFSDLSSEKKVCLSECCIGPYNVVILNIMSSELFARSTDNV
jgi:hypothetical protein